MKKCGEISCEKLELTMINHEELTNFLGHIICICICIYMYMSMCMSMSMYMSMYMYMYWMDGWMVVFKCVDVCT